MNRLILSIVAAFSMTIAVGCAHAVADPQQEGDDSEADAASDDPPKTKADSGATKHPDAGPVGTPAQSADAAPAQDACAQTGACEPDADSDDIIPL